jgi:hypothetical protein
VATTKDPEAKLGFTSSFELFWVNEYNLLGQELIEQGRLDPNSIT